MIPYVTVQLFTPTVAAVINAAAGLFKGALANVIVRFELVGYEGTALVFENPAHLQDAGGAAAGWCCEESLLTATTTGGLETLTDTRVGMIAGLWRQLVYAFNRSPDGIEGLVADALRVPRT